MIFRTVVIKGFCLLVSWIFDGVGESLSVVQSGRDGAVDLTRPLRSEVVDRERREDGRDGVVHSFHRPERSVDVSGCRPDVAQETRPASVRVPQRVPEHSLLPLQQTCDDGSDDLPGLVDSSSDVVHALGRGDPA